MEKMSTYSSACINYVQLLYYKFVLSSKRNEYDWLLIAFLK